MTARYVNASPGTGAGYGRRSPVALLPSGMGQLCGAQAGQYLVFCGAKRLAFLVDYQDHHFPFGSDRRRRPD